MAVDLGDDPFAGYSLLSLLPRTLGGATEPSAVAAEQELDSIRAFLESITLKCSREILEQAQAIAQSSLNIVNLDLEDGDNAVLVNGKDRLHGQRPALGRKRARFSLKLVSSQSLTNANIDSNIDGIEDPEEFFLACENLDNAGKELKKLKREVSTELLEHHPSTAARKHRPGILGKTATYKHHFPALAGTAEAIVVSQDEIPDREISILPQTSMVVDSSNIVSPKGIDQPQNPQSREADINELFDENEREGSVAQKDKKIDDLYYRLLSCDNLDGEKGQAFLRESLQIQQVDVGKMHLPSPFGSQKDNVNPVNSISARKKLENSQCLQISPSQPKSPLAVIFAFQRRLSLENPLKGQYSLHPSDGDPSLTRGQDRYLVSPIVDGNHCDISGAITDGASTPARTSMKRVSLADKMHSSVLKSDKTTGDMIPTWKSHKLISLEDSSHDQTSDRRHDNNPISPSTNIDSCDTSSSMPDGASPPSMKEKISNLEDMPRSLFPRSDGITGNKVTSKQQPMEHSSCSLEIDAACESSRFDNDKNAVSIGFDGHLEEEDNGMQLNAVAVEPDSCLQQEANNIEHDASASVQSGPGLEDLSSGPVNANAKEGSVRDADTNILREDATIEGRVNDTEHAEQGSQDGEAVKDKSNTPQAVSLTDGHMENMHVSLEETNVGPRIDSAMLANRRKQKAPSRRQNKQKPPSERRSSANSEIPPGEGTRQKTVPCGQKKQNSLSKRQSLAGAGTTWQSGVRRSTRIKSRPLQYWCGERFLYGRIHDSLATVIGIKYASPGDSKLKVKSYVSEEYADLVAQVAL